MRPIRDAWVLQVEVTSRCSRRCVQCTRLCHHRQPAGHWQVAAADLAVILSELRQHWAGKIGIIGGEPTIHPEFPELCDAVGREWTSRGLWAGLWTAGGVAFNRHRALINSAFTWIAMNDKRGEACLHQRLFVASRDAVPDAGLRRQIQDACWVQRDWAPTIAPTGVWFCEVAASISRVLWPEKRGWAIAEPWESYGPAEFEDQREACEFCGMCLPQPRDHIDSKHEFVSKSWLDEFGTGRHRMPYPQTLADLRISTWEQFLALAQDWRPGEYAPGRAKGGL
jgi:hypothetical protein